MKKLLCCFLLALLLLPHAFAAPLRVNDEAGLLANDEMQKLLTRADELSAKHGADVLILTTNDSRGMVLGNFAADYVDYNDFSTDNIVLTVAMDQRKYVCVTTGSCIRAFTDYALDAIYDAMEDDMIAGNYLQAFDRYLELCDRVLKQADLGAPYDYNNPLDPRTDSEILGMRLVLSLLPGFLIAWIIAAVQKSAMKTSRAQESAHSYLTDMRLTRERDIYLYTTTRRVKIQSNSGGSGGGSSTFSGSSGRSHGGGGGGRSF